MPYRKVPFAKNEVYHVFNRAVASQQIFKSRLDYLRLVEVIRYYRFSRPQISYSQFLDLSQEIKEQYLRVHQKKQLNIDILAFCIMPNHIHFLLRQRTDKGVSEFMRNIQNSYAKYFNTKNQRSGSLFQSMFKAVRIENDKQLIHVSRYIHLNPSSSYLVKIEDAIEYEWSSFPTYLNKSSYDFISTDLVLNLHKSQNDYFRFVMDQAGYQRRLQDIKHLILEE